MLYIKIGIQDFLDSPRKTFFPRPWWEGLGEGAELLPRLKSNLDLSVSTFQNFKILYRKSKMATQPLFGSGSSRLDFTLSKFIKSIISSFIAIA